MSLARQFAVWLNVLAVVFVLFAVHSARARFAGTQKRASLVIRRFDAHAKILARILLTGLDGLSALGTTPRGKTGTLAISISLNALAAVVALDIVARVDGQFAMVSRIARQAAAFVRVAPISALAAIFAHLRDGELLFARDGRTTLARNVTKLAIPVIRTCTNETSWASVETSCSVETLVAVISTHVHNFLAAGTGKAGSAFTLVSVFVVDADALDTRVAQTLVDFRLAMHSGISGRAIALISQLTRAVCNFDTRASVEA